MNNFLKSIMVGCFLLISVIPSYGANIVIDPGHNGFEQNRGGGAFTVDFVGDQLATVEDTGSIMIQVNDASHFSSDTEYDTIKIGDETKNIQSVSYSSNIITLSSGLSEQHSAGEPVKVVDFLVQAMGRKFDGTDPDSWAGSDTDFEELSYTHAVSADEWDSWARKTKVDGTRLGLLEVLNTWEIATRLRDKLDTGLGHTVTMTKSQALETVSFEDRTGAVAQPDIFISIHTNGGTTSARGPIYVPYKTQPYDQNYSFPDRSTVWSPSHGFNADWFVGSDTSQFDTAVSKIQDTPVLLVDHDYHFRLKDKDANPVDPFTVRHQIFDLDAGTTSIGSTLSDTVDGFGPLGGSSDRQSRGKVYANAFTFSETGPYRTDLRGPFQADQQDTLGLELVDALDDVVSSNRADPDVNCSDGGNCDLALGSWLGDIRDGHDPAFTLSEVAFHTNPDNAEWLINNCESSCGFDTSAEKIANVLDPYSPTSQDEKFNTGKEYDRPHPFEVRTLTMQGKVRNKQTGSLLGSEFNLKLNELSSGNDFSGTGSGNTSGILISDFDTGTYSGTVTQVGGSGGSNLECPGDWSTFYERSETEPIELTQDFDGAPVIQHDFYVWPQGRFSGTVSDSNGEFLQDAAVKIIPEGNSDTQVTSPNTPAPGQSHGSYHFCGIDQTDVDADPPSSYTITASQEGYFSDTITGLTMTSDAIVEVDTLVLEPKTGSVSGKIKDKFSGTGKRYSTYEIKNSAGDIVKSANANYFGEYEEELMTGDYQIKGETDNYLPSSWINFTVSANQTTNQDVPMHPYRDIQVTDFKADPGDTTLGCCDLTVSGGGISRTEPCSATGTNTFYDLEPGITYYLTGEGCNNSQTVSLPEGTADAKEVEYECSGRTTNCCEK